MKEKKGKERKGLEGGWRVIRDDDDSRVGEED